MSTSLPHISVCVCTYKRPELLRRSLASIVSQTTDGAFTYSVVVTDNDAQESGRTAAMEVAGSTSIPLLYCVEPRPGIAMARNKAVANATGDFVAFLDDDEFVPERWLLTLFKTINAYRSDGVLGPVNPHFEEATPPWIIQGGFYDRPVHPTGMQLHWKKCRTGNVLLKRELFENDTRPFDPQCLCGEDQDFFRRQGERGRVFVWCHEAPALEVVPAARWKRGFLMRRAIFRGVFAQRNHGLQPVRLMQAFISVPAYLLALPIALAFGQARFMSCVFKLSYHAGRILGFLGINPIGQSYVTE